MNRIARTASAALAGGFLAAALAAPAMAAGPAMDGHYWNDVPVATGHYWNTPVVDAPIVDGHYWNGHYWNAATTSLRTGGPRALAV